MIEKRGGRRGRGERGEDVKSQMGLEKQQQPQQLQPQQSQQPQQPQQSQPTTPRSGQKRGRSTTPRKEGERRATRAMTTKMRRRPRPIDLDRPMVILLGEEVRREGGKKREERKKKRKKERERERERGRRKKKKENVFLTFSSLGSCSRRII